jgi:hypothetical protein
MAKDRINRDELADKLVERAAEAEDLNPEQDESKGWNCLLPTTRSKNPARRCIRRKIACRVRAGKSGNPMWLR